MKKTLALLLLSFSLFAQQKVRTFDNFGISYGINDQITPLSISFGQEIEIGSNFNYSFGAFAKLNWTRLQAQSLKSAAESNDEVFSIKDKRNAFNLSIPLSASIGFKNLSLGGSFDFASLSFGKNLSSEDFTLNEPNEGLIARQRNLSWILNKENQAKNLSNQLFLTYSFERTISIRVGMNSQRISYDLRNLDPQGKVGTRENIFGQAYIYPFISLRFNNEK